MQLMECTSPYSDRRKVPLIFKKEGLHSVLMQPVVDFRRFFMHVNIGWPGKVHDARV